MKKRNSQYLIPIFLIAALLSSGGCNKEEKPLQSPPPAQQMPVQKALAPVQKQPSSAKSSTPAASLMDFTNRKDPFKPFVNNPAQPAKQAQAVSKKDLLPIQNYELNKFKIAGIIVGLKENRALVIDPTGKGYVVKQGMLIGSNDGVVNRITPTTIEVIEKYNDNGHIRKVTSKLSLPSKK